MRSPFTSNDLLQRALPHDVTEDVIFPAETVYGFVADGTQSNQTTMTAYAIQKGLKDARLLRYQFGENRFPDIETVVAAEWFGATTDVSPPAISHDGKILAWICKARKESDHKSGKDRAEQQEQERLFNGIWILDLHTEFSRPKRVWQGIAKFELPVAETQLRDNQRLLQFGTDGSLWFLGEKENDYSNARKSVAKRVNTFEIIRLSPDRLSCHRVLGESWSDFGYGLITSFVPTETPGTVLAALSFGREVSFWLFPEGKKIYTDTQPDSGLYLPGLVAASQNFSEYFLRSNSEGNGRWHRLRPDFSVGEPLLPSSVARNCDLGTLAATHDRVALNYLMNGQWNILSDSGEAIKEDDLSLAPLFWTGKNLWLLGIRPEAEPELYHFDSETKSIVSRTKNTPVTRAKFRAETIDFQLPSGSFGHLYLPKTESLTTPKPPLVLYIKGGPVSTQLRNSLPSPVRMLLASGFAVCSVNYRASSGQGLQHMRNGIGEFLGHADCEDIVEGVRWLKNNHMDNFDVNNLGVYGYSWGGYLSLQLAALYPEEFKVIACGGVISDWMIQQPNTEVRYYDFTLVGGMAGGWVKDLPDHAKKCSPVNIFLETGVKVPTLLVQGENDVDTPADQVRELEAKLKGISGKPNRLKIEWYQGQGHGFDQAHRWKFWQSSLLFLTKHLKPWNLIDNPAEDQHVYS